MLGKYLRNIRIDHYELMFDMANKLQVSSADISKVETGKMPMPLEWADKLAEIYNLTKGQKNTLIILSKFIEPINAEYNMSKADKEAQSDRSDR